MSNERDPPTNYGVRGLNAAQRAAWNRLSLRPTVPTRYPSDEETRCVGIRRDFWELCHTGDGQGLRTVFMGKWPSYRGYTLEFLSTLTVNKRRRGKFKAEVEGFSFRLGNENRELSVGEFEQVFATRAQGGRETLNFNEFWQMITLEQGGFESGKSKSSAIRNPVLRYLHRAISNVIFARTDSGSVNNSELYCIFSLLRGHGCTLHQHMGDYWARVAKNTTGTICCGGMITALCVHFGVALDPAHALIGERFLTYEGLFHMDVIKTDRNQHAYCPQLRAGDHFPLPSPALTKVDTWENQDNWLMNSPAHLRVIAAFPAALPWQIKRKPIGGPFNDPGAIVGGSGGGEAMEEDEEDDGEEEDDGDEDEADDENDGDDGEGNEEGAEEQAGGSRGGANVAPRRLIEFHRHPEAQRRPRSRQQRDAQPSHAAGPSYAGGPSWAQQMEWNDRHNAAIRAQQAAIEAHNAAIQAQNASIQQLVQQMQQQGASVTTILNMLKQYFPNYMPPPPPPSQ